MTIELRTFEIVDFPDRGAHEVVSEYLYALVEAAGGFRIPVFSRGLIQRDYSLTTVIDFSASDRPVQKVKDMAYKDSIIVIPYNESAFRSTMLSIYEETTVAEVNDINSSEVWDCDVDLSEYVPGPAGACLFLLHDFDPAVVVRQLEDPPR